MINKIAIGNVIKHKWSSMVILAVFAVSAFVIYWAFGFSNTFTTTMSEEALKSNGHLAYQIDYINKETGNELFKIDGVSEIVLERRVGVAFTSKKESGMLIIGEITSKYKDTMKNIKLDKGRLPENDDEIVISNQYDETKLELGDSIYVTAFTPDKVVNAVKFKIVGVGKIGAYSMIQPTAMNTMINTNEYFNTAVIYLSGEINEKAVEAADLKIKQNIKKKSIKIEESRNYFRTMRENEAIMISFEAMKIILLTVMFPLTGAILGALIWIHSYKRRKELWTYVAMGYKDRQIMKIVRLEYMIIAFGGTLAGIGAGALSSLISQNVNGTLSFTYIMNMLMVAKIGILDIVFIVLFMAGNTVFWMRFPINRIIKAKPFSF